MYFKLASWLFIAGEWKHCCIRKNKMQESGSDVLVLHRAVKVCMKLANSDFVRKLKSDNCPSAQSFVCPQIHSVFVGKFTRREEAPHSISVTSQSPFFPHDDLPHFFYILSTSLAVDGRVSYSFLLHSHRPNVLCLGNFDNPITTYMPTIFKFKKLWAIFVQKIASLMLLLDVSIGNQAQNG